MSKLVVNVGTRPANLALIEVPCTSSDADRFSAEIGNAVLLAETVDAVGGSYFADARLREFAIGPQSQVICRLDSIETFATDVDAANQPETKIFYLVSDIEAAEINTKSRKQTPMEEMTSPFITRDIFAEIAQQVRLRQNNICGFSGVAVPPSQGVATPLMPVAAGGEAHVRNFIFLHDEPATLFARFAWTIGPDLEIIVDSFAVGQEIMSTINPKGKLALGSDTSLWPSEKALAWHREQFFSRLA